MRDPDVRSALVTALAQRLGQRPHVLVPEVDVRWTVPARLDALLVADRICGFEIKSDVDSLARLPRQIQAYGAVVERAVLVVSERHRAAALEAVPHWWSVWVAGLKGEHVVIRSAKRGRLNPALNPLAVSTFLTREDLLHALRSRGHAGLSSFTVDQLRQQFTTGIAAREAVRVARSYMIERRDWRGRSLLTA
ncbi:sce7726 family protein [Motilibacter aurantiacus]|uniref:sce7726 family protein n=1 Tax=Motilibacter aurantiacus TaxID=2714955 RepID=UPI00140BA56B|nr:sce7726 family protein [Motilibacter aurantiacus]